jgi:N-acetyl-anhydromuramyl-L-alanine amidase AmpD
MIPKEIVIHHTASSRDNTTVKNIDDWHKLRWADFRGSLGYWIGYHYVILGNGEVVQTRRDNEMGAHCIPNDGKIGIALTGNFDIEAPSEAQLNSLSPLLTKLKLNYGLTDNNIYGHWEKSATACPGREMKKWLLLTRQVSLLRKLIDFFLKLKGR